MKKFSKIIAIIGIIIMAYTFLLLAVTGVEPSSTEWNYLTKVMAGTMLAVAGLYISGIILVYTCYWGKILYHAFMVKVLKHNNHKKLAYVTIHKMEHLWD